MAAACRNGAACLGGVCAAFSCFEGLTQAPGPVGAQNGTATMAKSATVKIKLVSTADTGFFYVTKKNPRNQTEKMSFRKYDPVARKHVEFKEAKIK